MSNKKLVKIKPILAVLCDDIRIENTGKPMIIGIYNGDIQVNFPTLPKDSNVMPSIFMSLWIPFEVPDIAGEAIVEIKISGPNPKHQVKVNAQAKFDKVPPKHEITAFSVTDFPVFAEKGILEISYRNKGENKWILLRSVPVIVNS